MIPYTFDYYRPDTITEAIQIFQELDVQGELPLYYNGGSEIISMARVNNICTKAVIDLKNIPECYALELTSNGLIIGASLTLSQLVESNVFPLLSKACGRIADHTMQCKITLGGNVCGTIIYKEALLSLLLTDCEVVIAGNNGKLKKLSIHDVFNLKLLLMKGEFIVQFIIDNKYLDLPYFHVKKTKNEKIDYPLITLAALKVDGNMRFAFSGLCEFPFRSSLLEAEFNDKRFPLETRLDNILQRLSTSSISNYSGSNQYRLFVLKNMLSTIEKKLGE